MSEKKKERKERKEIIEKEDPPSIKSPVFER